MRAWTSVKIAVLAPMPSASVTAAVAVKALAASKLPQGKPDIVDSHVEHIGEYFARPKRLRQPLGVSCINAD